MLGFPCTSSASELYWPVLEEASTIVTHHGFSRAGAIENSPGLSDVENGDERLMRMRAWVVVTPGTVIVIALPATEETSVVNVAPPSCESRMLTAPEPAQRIVCRDPAAQRSPPSGD